MSSPMMMLQCLAILVFFWFEFGGSPPLSLAVFVVNILVHLLTGGVGPMANSVGEGVADGTPPHMATVRGMRSPCVEPVKA